MIAMLWSFLITVAVVGAYLMGVTVGEARMEEQIDELLERERRHGET